jgi:protein gp37
MRSAPWRGKTPEARAYHPQFHPERLEQPLKEKQPGIVFVGSVSDIMDEAFSDDQIASVIAVAARAHWHTFVFLTKCSHRLSTFNPWPENGWVGASAENGPMFERALEHLESVSAAVRFISCEPLLGPIFDSGPKPCIDWMIIGGETSNGRPTGKTQKTWVLDLASCAGAWGLPIFVKNNIPCLTPRAQEWPRNYVRL